MTTAFATQSTKPKPRKVNPLGKLLAAHNELLGAWIVSGLPGHMKIRQHDDDGSYSIEYCGHDPIGFESLTIYQGDRNFELKKQCILDYLEGKITSLEEKGKHL